MFSPLEAEKNSLQDIHTGTKASIKHGTDSERQDPPCSSSKHTTARSRPQVAPTTRLEAAIGEVGDFGEATGLFVCFK
jgi:hypothetical protein